MRLVKWEAVPRAASLTYLGIMRILEILAVPGNQQSPVEILPEGVWSHMSNTDMSTYILEFTEGNLPRSLHLTPILVRGKWYADIEYMGQGPAWPRERHPSGVGSGLGTAKAVLWACFEWVEKMHGIKRLRWEGGAPEAPQQP